MKEIKCPHCNQQFSVDESTFESIALQVRNTVFEEELERRLSEMRSQLQSEFKAEKIKEEKDFSEKLAKKEGEQASLRAEMDLLRGRLNSAEENLKLQAETQRLKEAQEHQAAMAREAQEHQAAMAKKDQEIQALKSNLQQKEGQLKVAVLEEQQKLSAQIQKKENEILRLNSSIVAQKAESEKEITRLQEQHNALIKLKDEEIQRQKDFKLRLSTKMLGETLEQHCAIMFEQAQSMGMYPGAQFGKDNDASGGSKGDFIFRDFDENGNEYISIMFEMKNEADATATKHKNEHFLDKLNKDRNEKHCDYAVLVSMLEQDSELYNAGIVNMSHRYDKMFVIRPQMFMILIALLAQAARKGRRELITLQRELEIARAQSVDVTNFEEKRDKFAQAFGKLVKASVEKQEQALGGIDKVIAALEKQAEELRKVKNMFETSRAKLTSANDKVENDFTIKKLTRGNKTMKAKFAEAAQARNERLLSDSNSDSEESTD